MPLLVKYHCYTIKGCTEKALTVMCALFEPKDYGVIAILTYIHLSIVLGRLIDPCMSLRGHNTQYSGHIGQIFSN